MAFIIVAVLLWKFARKPAAQMLHNRIASIESELGEAAQARQAAEAERDRIKAALADSDTEAARIIDEARASADQLAADIEARAGTDVAAVRERAAADLASARTPGRVGPLRRAVPPLARCRRARRRDLARSCGAAAPDRQPTSARSARRTDRVRSGATVHRSEPYRTHREQKRTTR